MSHRTKFAGIAVCGFLLLFGYLINQADLLLAAKKMKPEELVALHLDSIGSPQLRAARKNISAQGRGQYQVLVGEERPLQGRAAFWSDGRSFRSSIRFDVSDYPGEEIAFDGKKTYVAQLNPGQRSLIGEFLYRYEVLLKEGLLGGSLSTAWPLLDLKNRKPKLKYQGLKRFRDREHHELRYRLRRGGTDFRITLYFEDKTFRHIATIYKLEIPETLTMIRDPGVSGAARAAATPREVPTRHILEESFSDYRTVDGLTLPHQWSVRFITENRGQQVGLFSAANRDLTVVELHYLFDKVRQNVAIDPKTFVLY